MKNIQKSALLLAGLLLVATACENGTEPNPQTQADLLCGSGTKSWKMTSVRSESGVTMPQSNCIMDDLYIFSASKAFELDEGATKCNTSDPQKQTGTWGLSNEIIRVKLAGKADLILEIKSLSSSKLVAYSNVSGAKTEVTYQAQ